MPASSSPVTSSRVGSITRWVVMALVFGSGAWLFSRYHHPVFGFTAFFQLEPSFAERALPEIDREPVYVHRGDTGYDGQFYAQLALRPLLDDPELNESIDNAPMRARRILASWIAYASALGNPWRTLHNYAWINVVGWFGFGVVLWRLLPPDKGHGLVAWVGLMFSAGTLTSVRYALTDLPALLLIACSMWALTRRHSRFGPGLMAAAALARETSILASLPWLIDATWRQRIVRSAILALPLALWLLYIRSLLGSESASLSNFDWPLISLGQKFTEIIAHIIQTPSEGLPWLALGSWLGLVAQMSIFILRPTWRNPWWQLGAPFVVLLVFLGWPTFAGYPGAATRILLPLHLAFVMLVPRSRPGLLWLLIGNLSIGMGLSMMRDHHHDADEFAAAVTDDGRYILRLVDGAYPLETLEEQRWVWSTGDTELWIRRYGDDPRPPVVRFRLVGFTPCPVTIRSADRELWSGVAEPTGTDITLVDYSESPTAWTTLMFSTEQVGKPESDLPSARALTFAIYDPSPGIP